MSIIYVVGGYVNSQDENYREFNLESKAFEYYLDEVFKHSNLTFFPDAESAKQFQLTTDVAKNGFLVKQWKILYEVQLKDSVTGPYIEKLIMASFLTSKGNTVEIKLDYSLPAERFLITHPEIEKLRNFMSYNEQIEDSSKLLPEIMNKIFGYSYKLAFFKEQSLPKDHMENNLVQSVLGGCTIF